MRSMRKIVGVLLALMLMLGMSSSVFAATDVEITTKADDTRTYKVYQIFTGDLHDDKLSNVKWGKNGNGAVGEAVADETISSLVAVNGAASDVTKLMTITGLVNFNSDPIGMVDKDHSLNVPTGYYLIQDATADLAYGQTYSLYVVKVVGPTEISPKASEVTSYKKVKDTNDTDGVTTDWQDSADYDIGDAVPFQLTGTVASDYDAYKAEGKAAYTYTFHDKLSAGLTFDANSVKVYVDGNEITGDYEVVTDGLADDCTFEVRFADLKAIDSVKAGSKVTVEYSAILNENAVIGSVGNTNEMYLQYANNPNTLTGATPSTGTTPEDKVIVFTYKTVVDKVDGNNDPLAGATFMLEKKVGSTWEVIGEVQATEVKDGDTVVSYTFGFEGLDDGDYRLTETVTPAGYNTADPLEFTITAEHDIDSAAPMLTDLSGGGQLTADVDAGQLSTTVVNKSGSELPETGGMGTTILYIAGALLIVGAGAILVIRRRRTA